MVTTRRTLVLAAALLCSPATGRAAPAPAKPALVAGTGARHAGLFRAGSEGATFSICGGGRLRLEANTEIRLFPVAQRLALVGGKRVTTFSLLVRTGRVDVELAETSTPGCAVLVSAPRKLSALVLSGQAAVRADAASSSIASFDGELLASTGDGFKPMAPSNRKTVSDRHAGTTEPLLTQSTAIRGQRALVSLGSPARLRTLSWQPVPGATGYRVKLRRAADGELVASATTRDPELGSAIGGMTPGRYVVSVQAIDASGIEGLTARASVTVVGAELPPGAFLDRSGTIRLAEDQTVRFTHVDGLQMTYGNAGHYVRASAEIGLYRDGPTIVHFRAPGSAETVRARLAPRGIAARVFAGPKTARWPSDPLTLVVKLEDRLGRPLPSFIEAHPRVTLGIEPLEVEWKREGRTLTATVPPQAVPGPWVVRVDVEDQFGLPLGRDFVEIAPSPSRRRTLGSAPRRPGALSAR